MARKGGEPHILAGQPVATDDGGGVDLALHQVISILQELSSYDHLKHNYTHHNLLWTQRIPRTHASAGKGNYGCQNVKDDKHHGCRNVKDDKHQPHTSDFFKSFI